MAYLTGGIGSLGVETVDTRNWSLLKLFVFSLNEGYNIGIFPLLHMHDATNSYQADILVPETLLIICVLI